MLLRQFAAVVENETCLRAVAFSSKLQLVDLLARLKLLVHHAVAVLSGCVLMPILWCWVARVHHRVVSQPDEPLMACSS